MRSINFMFVKKLDLKLYGLLCEIEFNSRINPVHAAHRCRILYETLLKDKRGIETASGLHMPGKASLPEINARCYMQNKSICIEKMDAYSFIKNLGNAGSHDEPYPWNEDNYNPVPDTANVIHALSVFHRLISLVYKERIADKVKPFNEHDVPIGEFFIDTEKNNVADTARTHCVKEYMVYKYTSDNVNRKTYGLVREYLADDIPALNKMTFERMLDVYGVLGSKMRREGIALRKLNEPGTEYANFFVVYEYDDNMIPLRQFLKNTKLNSKDTIKLCLDIAKQLSLFHHAEDHVYLRLLTYDSIMVRRPDPNGIIVDYDPVIIKFEFAKIEYNDSDESGMTILSLLQEVSDRDANESNKRISRYCINTEFEKGTDWEKVDVGSLGVLFTDICEGAITTKDTDYLIEKFIDKENYPAEMTDLLTRMTDTVNIWRPTLKQVIDELTRIVESQ